VQLVYKNVPVKMLLCHFLVIWIHNYVISGIWEEFSWKCNSSLTHVLVL